MYENDFYKANLICFFLLQFESGSTGAFAFYRLTGISGLTIKSKKKSHPNFIG